MSKFRRRLLESAQGGGLPAGTVLEFPYTGNVQEVTLPKGTYKLECWGAEGGYRSSSSYSGKGGYSYGTLTLQSKTTLYVYSGGSGKTGGTNGGFNGGGKRATFNGGGGASDIRIGTDSLYARVIVAGGGGSDGASAKTGMYGGGTSGGSTTQSYGSGGFGGTQTGVSDSLWQTTSQSPSTSSISDAYAGFGFGGNGVFFQNGYGGAGGGGWYGGSGAYPDGGGDDDRGGGGGSGYVYTSNTASSYPSGCLLNDSHYLTNASTVAGDLSFTNPTGSAETGHSGNGYARITVIGSSSGGGSSALPNGYTQVEYIQSSGSQYIDTGIYPNQNTTIEISAYTTDTSNDKPLFGERNGNNVAFLAWTNPQNTAHPAFAFHDTGNVDTYFGFTSGIKHTIMLYNGGFICDGKVYSFATKTFKSSYKLLLFGLNNAGSIDSRKFYGRVYSCKIYDNDTLVRDYAPCVSPDGEYGLYDLVEHKFYSNQGTGQFTGA